MAATDHQGSGAAASDASGSELSELLLEALAALARAGEVDAACRLAGRACVSLRLPSPSLARRFDVLLHRLAHKLTW